MSATTDTFNRFIDVVADTMDVPGTSGDDVASRAHMSRFHFDRVVAAVAGETPGAFRRRVLLERAAYELVTGGRGVLDIAVSAGYSSHEAFTRAFSRAFDRSPSRWRKSPGPTFWLGAPSGVHFTPPGGLRVPARRKVTAMDILTQMVEHHTWLINEMIDRAARLDDETLDKPIQLSVEGIDDDPTLRRLLIKLVDQMAMWNAVVAGRTPESPETESMTQLGSRATRVGSEFRALVQQMTDGERLDESFVDAMCEPAHVFTYGGMFAHVLAFGAHRRCLVLGALHDAGVTDLGAGTPMGWLTEHAG